MCDVEMKIETVRMEKVSAPETIDHFAHIYAAPARAFCSAFVLVLGHCPKDGAYK